MYHIYTNMSNKKPPSSLVRGRLLDYNPFIVFRSSHDGMNFFSMPMQIPHIAENISKDRYAITIGA